MKTSDLIADLARDLPPTPRRPVVLRLLGPALAVGLAVGVAVVAMWLGFQPMKTAMAIGGWWLKLGYALSLAGLGFALALRLARPDGGHKGWLLGLAVLAVAVMVILGAGQLMIAPGGEQMAMMKGQSWTACSRRIITLAVPAFVLAFLALRRLAPTRPAAAGAAAGLMAGGLGAAAYAMHCPEMAPAFVAIWYTLGIAACAATGGLLGSRLLRW